MPSSRCHCGGGFFFCPQNARSAVLIAGGINTLGQQENRSDSRQRPQDMTICNFSRRSGQEDSMIHPGAWTVEFAKVAKNCPFFCTFFGEPSFHGAGRITEISKVVKVVTIFESHKKNQTPESREGLKVVFNPGVAEHTQPPTA